MQQSDRLGKLTPQEKARVERICKALLHERQVWARRWTDWFKIAQEKGDSAGLDAMLKHDRRFEPFKQELIDIMRRGVPEFDMKHVPTMIDLYAAQVGRRWDGAPLGEKDEVWIGVPMARLHPADPEEGSDG